MAVARHINLFELQKACVGDACPLCRIIADRTARYIDNLLFEHVSDRGFRAAYRQAGGFCANHSQSLASYRDGLAVAILGKDILEDRILAFKKRRPWRPKAECAICVERGRIEHEYLGFLLEADGDSPEERELRSSFEASDGLCAPHYGQLVALGRKTPEWLRVFHEKRFESLYKRVARFIELSAYGRQAEFAKLSEKDQLVWKELALVLRGNIS